MKIEKKCPTCKVITIYGEHAHFPFCSTRCRDRDLIGWSQGEHVLTTPITDEDDLIEFERRVLEQCPE